MGPYTPPPRIDLPAEVRLRTLFASRGSGYDLDDNGHVIDVTKHGERINHDATPDRLVEYLRQTYARAGEGRPEEPMRWDQRPANLPGPSRDY